MTFFSEPNEDAFSVSPDAAATGPLVGFFESFNTSVEAQMRASAQFGIEYFMQEVDWNQTRAMLDAGVENPPQLLLSLEGNEPGEGMTSVAQTLRRDSGYYEDFIPERSGGYLDVARKYAGDTVSDEFDTRLQEYDARIEALRAERPELNLQSSREMFERVRKDAQDAERRQQTDRRTIGGTFGDFAGGALASMHPGTDPLNFFTLGVGGVGKTAMQRILAQTGGQGAIEAVNQVTGVQEERRLLGVSHGFADAAIRVGTTALAGGALQSVGEAVGAGVKRWFRNSPEDPAPPASVAERSEEPLALPHPDQFKEEGKVARLEQDGRTYIDMIADEAPLSGIRAGKPRTVADIADATRQLEEWGGVAPSEMRPRTENAAFPGAPSLPRIDVEANVQEGRIHQIAREVDPATMGQYDKLLTRQATYRRWLDELAEGRDADIEATVSAIDRRIHALEARRSQVQGKGAKAKVREELREAKADREKVLTMSGRQETPDVAMVRRSLVELDERMRDLAPLIGRAYARARGQWAETAEELDEVWSAYRDGRPEVDAAPETELPDFDTAMTLADRAPIMRQADQVEPGPTSADTAMRIVEENTKLIDDAVETYRQSVKGLLSATEDGKLTVAGHDYEFDINKDTIFVDNLDGTGAKEVKIKDFLNDTKRADEEIEAMSACSISKTS